MIERVLTTRELNRAMLGRQLLLERSPLPLTRALERVAGLQTQYAPSGYIGLWSRLRDFDRDALTKALTQRRVIQATLMRSTIHMVSASDFWLFAAGTTAGRREWFLRIARKQLDARQMAAAATIVRKRLLQGPTRATELRQLLEQQHLPAVAWAGLSAWLDMVRVPPSGTWEQRRADLYALAESWIPKTGATAAEGLTHLIRRYLGGFGPATQNEIADWAGLPVTRLKPALERLRLRRFRSERGSLLLDLPDAPLPAAETPAPIRFLPTWDATLLVHARRTQVLPEAYRPKIFSTKTPHSVPTFLVDGQVAGTWRSEGGRITAEPFEPVPRVLRRELDDELKQLTEFHAR